MTSYSAFFVYLTPLKCTFHCLLSCFLRMYLLLSITTYLLSPSLCLEQTHSLITIKNGNQEHIQAENPHSFVLLRYFGIRVLSLRIKSKSHDPEIPHAHPDRLSDRSLSPAMDSTVLTFAFSILCRKMECAKVSFVILRKDDNKTPVKLNNMIYILADTFPKNL